MSSSNDDRLGNESQPSGELPQAAADGAAGAPPSNTAPATSNKPSEFVTRVLAAPGGHLNFPHLWPGQTPPPDVTGRMDGYSRSARLATRSAACLSRQLRPSNLSRWPWCMSRSRSGATTTTSPRSAGQSSIGRLEVMMVEAFS